MKLPLLRLFCCYITSISSNCTLALRISQPPNSPPHPTPVPQLLWPKAVMVAGEGLTKEDLSSPHSHQLPPNPYLLLLHL